MPLTVHRAADRGRADFGWFQAAYSFSFGSYHDPRQMGFGALRVLNDSTIQPGRGFPEHPHADFEIVTIQLEGHLSHTDSLGTRDIKAHDVQLITAGTGVAHSDLNTGAGPARQLQIWMQPRTQGLRPSSTIRSFPAAPPPNAWLPLVAPTPDPHTLLIQQEAWFALGAFEAGHRGHHPLHGAGQGVYLFVLEGELEVEGIELRRRDAAAFTYTAQVAFTATAPSQVLLIEVPMA